MSVSIEVLPFETLGDFHSGGIRHHLPRHGTPIGPNDLLIAAHARSLHLTVATAGGREFSRIPDLQVESWKAD